MASLQLKSASCVLDLGCSCYSSDLIGHSSSRVPARTAVRRGIMPAATPLWNALANKTKRARTIQLLLSWGAVPVYLMCKPVRASLKKRSSQSFKSESAKQRVVNGIVFKPTMTRRESNATQNLSPASSLEADSAGEDATRSS